MKRNFRKAVSIICVVAVLMSLCVVSAFNTTSAFQAKDEPVGGTLKLDFENKKGVSNTTSSKKTEMYVTDPADPNNTVVQLYSQTASAANMEIGTAGADTLDGTQAFILLPNTKYKLTFIYKFGKGSYRANNTMSLNLYAGTGSAVSGKTKLADSSTYKVVPADNPETTIVSDKNSTVNILANDTEWFTFNAMFETGETVTNDNLYINMPNDPQTAPYGKMTCYIDNVMIDIIDEEDDPFEIREYNFKDDETGDFWNPNDHVVFSLSDSANNFKSFVDEQGAHFSVNQPNGASTVSMWRQKMFIYDTDFGGYLKLEDGKTYHFTMKYKVVDATSSSAVIGIGRNTDPKAGPTTSQPLVYFEKVWNKHSSDDNGKSFELAATFTADSTTAGSHAAVVAGGGAHSFLIESIEIIVITDPSRVAIVDYEVGSGNPIDRQFFVAGIPSTELVTPTNNDPDRGFAGWFLDEEFTTPVGENLPSGNLTVYAKWTSDFAHITFNNSGALRTDKLAKGTALLNPERPNNSKLFFEGWYLDPNYTERVYEVPENDCTLYAKYNYTYLTFNNGGISDKSLGTTSVVTDPDDPTNKVAALYTAKGGTYNMEIGIYDAIGASAYKMTKLNTKYYIEFKVKVPAGAVTGTMSLMTGEQSAWSPDCSKGSTGLSYTWTSQAETDGLDWYTVSGFYTTGDSWYRERVNFSVQDQLYFTLGFNEGGTNTHGGVIYIDDVIIGEFSEEVPEGAVAIFFETNANDISPVLGYAGERVVMPENPVLGGHEFVGWYTDIALLTPYTGTTFPESSITLYAKWKTVSQLYDFTSFSTSSMSERYNVLTEGNNTFLEYNYEQSPSSGPGGNARVVINDGNQYKVINGFTYIIKFKYKINKVNVSGAFSAATHDSWSTWGNTTAQSHRVGYQNTTNGWKEAELKFVADCKTATSNSISLTVSGDANIYIDDIVIYSPTSQANIYGSTVIYFDSLGAGDVDPVSGNPGDPIILPSIKRNGFKFGGWYTENRLTNKFTQTTYGEENITLYAKWILGKINEGYENFPSSATLGVSSAYEIYEKGNTSITFDKANVYSGSTSIFRDGTKTGTKGFTLCRKSTLTLGVGEQYTITFYVKPSNVTNAAGVINLIQMSSSTAVNIPDSVDVITDVGSLKAGEWQKVSYTFTANQQYVGISTTEGNDIYFDSFNINLKNYVGTGTGDNTINPALIVMMVLLAAGAMIITAKKVFAK